MNVQQLEMSQHGYVLSRSWLNAGTYTQRYNFDWRIIPAQEAEGPPAFVKRQRAKLIELLKPNLNSRPYYPNVKPVGANATTPQGVPLTLRTIAQIGPGQYDFVLLPGESFVRVGAQHLEVGAGEIAEAAGSLTIGRDKRTGALIVADILNRSGTYQPRLESLYYAIEALWAQEVYSEHLQVYRFLDSGTAGLIVDLGK
jgi:hypothetical protein